MTDKMREEFEAEYIKSLNNDYFSCEDEKLVYIKMDDNGDYVHDLTHSAFHWWKSSRAALCVELPKQWFDEGLCCDLMEADHVAYALDAAGVSYK